ncbi:unnamed protein product [Parajaminaea phylloscopi]
MPLTLEDNGAVARLELPASGGDAATAARVDVLLHGATVLRWSARGTERLFLSSKTPLDGSSAIRGGIPIVFPVFGSPSDHEDSQGLEALPKHGLARTARWTLQQQQQQQQSARADAGADASSGQDEHVTATFTLSSGDIGAAAKAYPWAFELAYTVTLTRSALRTSLHVRNTSPSGSQQPSMRFQALLHNYLRVPSALTASVAGLAGQSFKDKTDDGKVKQLAGDDVVVVLAGKASDAVYLGPTPQRVDLCYVEAPGGVRLAATDNMPNTTVWNPAEEGARGIADLHPGGWKEYVCIEPGKVVGFEQLPAGQTWVASQTLQAY